MTRRFHRAIVVLVAALAGEGCRHSTSDCLGPIAPTGPTFTISGLITAYHGGPITGATVVVFPSEGSCNGTPDIQTNQQGRYNWSAPSSGPVSLFVAQSSYEAAYKNNLNPQQSTANFVLQPRVNVKPNGDTLAGTIAGDEFIAGDDVLFGGLCARAACKIVEFDLPGFQSPAVKLVDVRLRWNDPSRQLALYVSHVGNLEGPPFTSGTTSERHCCAAELVGTADLGKYFPDVIAVAFEQAAGGPPGPSDSQAFELTVRPLP